MSQCQLKKNKENFGYVRVYNTTGSSNGIPPLAIGLMVGIVSLIILVIIGWILLKKYKPEIFPSYRG